MMISTTDPTRSPLAARARCPGRVISPSSAGDLPRVPVWFLWHPPDSWSSPLDRPAIPNLTVSLDDSTARVRPECHPLGIWLTVWHALCILRISKYRDTRPDDPRRRSGSQETDREGWNMKTNWRIWAIAGVIAVGGLALGTSPAKAQGFSFGFSTGPGVLRRLFSPRGTGTPRRRGPGPGHRPAALHRRPRPYYRSYRPYGGYGYRGGYGTAADIEADTEAAIGGGYGGGYRY